MAPMSKSDLKGSLATLSSKLHKDVTLVVYGDVQTVLSSRKSEANETSLERIDYSIRFDSQIDNETAQKLDRLIEEITNGSRGRIRSDWMTSVNDVRMPFRLNDNRNPVSDFIEDSRRTRDVIYKRGHLTLIAAPLWWTVAIKLHWNGDQDIQFLARVFASKNFFGFAESAEAAPIQPSTGNRSDDFPQAERRLRQIELRALHIRDWLDSQCPRMKPVLQTERDVRLENIKTAVSIALDITCA